MKRTGILCAVFSLPGRHGIGDFGQCGRDFIDILKHDGVKIWQVLPLNPVGYGHSPYQPYSSYAGETLYIDLDSLYEDGLLKSRPQPFLTNQEKVDYDAVRAYKTGYFRAAILNFQSMEKPADYAEFCEKAWVRPYALFQVLKQKNGGKNWMEWEEEDKNCLQNGTEPQVNQQEVEFEIFLQYEFYKQWKALKAYAKEAGILIMGDIPFYVGQDSLDVWMNREEFLLDDEGYAEYIAGVPPDYFSETGQRWGNPIYDWEHMKENDYSFWRDRIKGTAEMFDIIRIDHFRAFDTYWKIPATCPTAMEGEWIEAPGYELFDLLLPEIPEVQIVAEDLGMMREEVYTLRDHYEFPGMNVVQFTLFDPGFKKKQNMVTYTGTHDNEMVRGWYESLSDREKRLARHKIHTSNFTKGKDISKAFVKYVLRAASDYVIVPVQDVMGRGNESRINVPGIVSTDNWCWKMTELQEFAEALHALKPWIE